MLSRFFKKANSGNLKKSKVKVCQSVKDFSNEEYFVKKAKAAREVLANSVFPKEFIPAGQ